jgi:hypothetical protein
MSQADIEGFFGLDAVIRRHERLVIRAGMILAAHGAAEFEQRMLAPPILALRASVHTSHPGDEGRAAFVTTS